MGRLTRDLCQDCWMSANPDEYFPVPTRDGVCGQCHYDQMVVRSVIANESDGTSKCLTCGLTYRGDIVSHASDHEHRAIVDDIKRRPWGWA